MPLFFTSRSGARHYFGWKTALFVLGTALVVVGIRLQRLWVLDAGIGVLVMAVLLRILGTKQEARDEEED